MLNKITSVRAAPKIKFKDKRKNAAFPIAKKNYYSQYSSENR
jgi:hypothetical protein